MSTADRKAGSSANETWASFLSFREDPSLWDLALGHSLQASGLKGSWLWVWPDWQQLPGQPGTKDVVGVGSELIVQDLQQLDLLLGFRQLLLGPSECMVQAAFLGIQPQGVLMAAEFLPLHLVRENTKGSGTKRGKRE